MSVEETLAGLVAIESISSRSNAEIIKHLVARTESLGLSVRHLPYTDERGVEKLNMIAIAAGDSATASKAMHDLLGITLASVTTLPAWR